MARSSLADPLDKFRWKVSIDGFTRFGFASVSVPSYTISETSYKEGGAHLTPRKIVDEISFAPVILTRGVTSDSSFNRWANGYIDLVQNNAATNANTESFSLDNISNYVQEAVSNYNVPSNTNDNYRKTVTIFHLNRAGVPIVTYTLYNAFPISYKPASDFDASGDNEISIESLTLTYESFDVKYSGAFAAAASIGSGVVSSTNII